MRGSSGSLNEPDLVARIREITSRAATSRVLLGIGDDAAVWQPSRSHRSVVSVDTLIENVHFRRSTATAEDIGAKAIAVNLSDLAAMGARPVLCVIALALPPDCEQDFVESLYVGITDIAVRYKLAIAGGDLSRSATLTITVTVIGEVSDRRITTRSDARPGNILAVTGPLGAAGAGLHILEARQNQKSGVSNEPAQTAGAHESTEADNATATVKAPDAAESAEYLLIEAALIQAQLRPTPRLAEGRFLAASSSVKAMMDISDGLSLDLARLCAASHCGADVETAPIHSAVASYEDHRSKTDPHAHRTHPALNPIDLALHGGEDYELLIAVERRAYPHIAARYRSRFNRPLIKIGCCTSTPALTYQSAPLPPKAHDHFRP